MSEFGKTLALRFSEDIDTNYLVAPSSVKLGLARLQVKLDKIV